MNRGRSHLPGRAPATKTLLVCAIASSLFAAAPAHAAFPGENGKIVFSDGASDLTTITPGERRDSSLVSSSQAVYVDPVFSAAGGRVAFAQRSCASCTSHIGTADIGDFGQGTRHELLTSTFADDREPAFSPDGRLIAFRRSSEPATGSIFVMNADGTDQTEITPGGGADSEPAFTPDGSRIVYVSNVGAHTDIFAMDTDGTDQVNLTNAPGNQLAPSVSPNGEKIVYQDGADIAVMDADGSDQDVIFDSVHDDSHPAFAPDGTRIAFRSDFGKFPGIYSINRFGDDLERITDRAGDRDPDWGVAPRRCDEQPATVVGTGGDDDIVGTQGRDVIVTGGGSDRVNALAGNDLICTGDGDDEVSAADGNDVVVTGSGDDRADADYGNDEVSAGSGADLVVGGPSPFPRPPRGSVDTDTLKAGSGDDTVRGGFANDVIAAGGGMDRLEGGTGKDDLGGAADDDVLIGGPNSAGSTLDEDNLHGGAGDDTLRGGDDGDFIVGGHGDDHLDSGPRHTGGIADVLLGGSGDDFLGGYQTATCRGGSGQDDYVGCPQPPPALDPDG